MYTHTHTLVQWLWPSSKIKKPPGSIPGSAVEFCCLVENYSTVCSHALSGRLLRIPTTGCGAASNPGGVGIHDQCMGSVSTLHHEDFGLLLICSRNFGLKSQQHIGHSTCSPHVTSWLAESSFTCICGQMNVRLAVVGRPCPQWAIARIGCFSVSASFVHILPCVISVESPCILLITGQERLSSCVRVPICDPE